MYHVLEDLESLVKGELRKIIGKKDMTPLELDNATKSICLLEKIHDLKMDYEDEEGYSRKRSYGRYPRYDEHDSYRRSRSYMDERNYSGHDHDITDKMVSRLEEMRMDAKSDHERDIVDEWISRISDH